MPQMKPTYWLLMYVMVISMLMSIKMSIFFFPPYLPISPSSNSCQNVHKTKWNWLW